MKKKSLIFIFFLTLLACDQSDDIAQEESQDLILLRTESTIDTFRYGTIYENIDLTYNSDNLLTNLIYNSTDQSDISFDITYAGNKISQIAEFSVQYGQNQITLTSEDRKEEYFLENEKIVRYKWYQNNTGTSGFELLVAHEFTYDENFRNVVKTEQFNPDGELFQYATYEYDSHRNPYAHFNGVLITTLSIPLSLFPVNSENNIVRTENFRKGNNGFESTIGTITYTYNDSDYPVNAKYNLLNGDYLIDMDLIYLE